MEIGQVDPLIPQVIHVPGLRGNPRRNYPVTAVGSSFPGTFETYAASVIAHWQASSDKAPIRTVRSALRRLGLTRNLLAKRVDETRVELHVGRLPPAAQVGPGAYDLVNIADVGLGVSQTLPVLVALAAARPGQLVYLEQPEIHLHPRAQTALAQVIAEAANRGVRMVVETHSELLILGVQTLVGEGRLRAEDVKLHWFERGADGVTHISSADLDERGTFGNWPEDFSEVALNAQSRFLDAAEAGAEAK